MGRPPSKRTMILMALLFLGVGAALVLLGAGIIPADPSAFNDPPWVIALIGGTFMLGGGMIALFGAGPNFKSTALFQWLQYAATVGFLGVFGIAITWVGLGPGHRAFSASVFGIMIADNRVNEWLGRVLFGGFGLLILAVALWLAITEPLRISGVWPRQSKWPQAENTAAPEERQGKQE